MIKQPVKHSPGPWTACKDGACTCGQIWSGRDKHVATVHASTTDSDGTTYYEWSAAERDANLNVIKLAPELLAMLRDVTEELALCEQDMQLVNTARALIARAEGREPQ